MSDHFTSIEDVISDENFLSWFLGNDEAKAKAWLERLAANPADRPIVDEAISFLSAMKVEEQGIPESQVDAAMRKLDRALQTPLVVRMPSKRKWWVPAAAAVLLILGTMVFTRDKKTVLATNYGKIASYRLPDGSDVLLNSHSALTLGKEWKTGKDREIWLKGEAFFKIQKTAAHDRFVVHASRMDIVVTGTQFNVVDRQDESSVLLTEGSVTIHTGSGKDVHMKPGDFVKIENNNPEKKPVDKEKVLAWKQSKLVFDHTPMRDVAAIITRYYNVKVSFSDSTIAKTEIGGIISNDSLDLLIESLEALGTFRIAKTDHQITISRP